MIALLAAMLLVIGCMAAYMGGRTFEDSPLFGVVLILSGLSSASLALYILMATL